MLLDLNLIIPIYDHEGTDENSVAPQVGHRFPIQACLAKLLDELLNDVFVSRGIFWYILPFSFKQAYPYLGTWYYTIYEAYCMLPLTISGFWFNNK